MFTFALGFLAEISRETGNWLDRILPSPRLRRALRGWRRRRPFWAAVWVIAGGVEMVAIPLAPLPLMIRVGVGAMSAVGISVVLVAGGLFFLFKPDQRMFVSIVTAVASLTSLATTNLGGFGIGMTAGLIGSSMAFGWMPRPAPSASAEEQATPTSAEGRSALPEAETDRARAERRRRRVRGAVLMAMSTVLAAAALPSAPSAQAASRTNLFPLPWPTLTWPWDTPAASPSPSAGATAPTGQETAEPPPGSAGRGDEPDTEARADSREAADATQVTLPCLTGVDTGGLPNAPSGDMPEDPDDLTALRPPVVIGDQPGRPRATYPVNRVYPTVGADSLTAYGAIIHGATYLRTADGGRLKVLWVHADRLVADNYTFRLDTPGQTQTIDVDLDIPQVDVYVTQLTGSITVPVLDVSTPRICVGADVVPANLPIAVQLPELSVTAVEAGQVLVDAETVGFTDLSAHARPR
ncbi:MAG: hypothetical protein HOZ81_00555 [Streptomyces sp.]|nr:hypothetical protein [Streptomyces sp.]NUS11893.1 hypothetical protein [Streptomyces sp.]NUS26372.1 hypothetical protein [Streptomyces sp.]